MVFGRVVEGMAVVKKMEAVGQRSGKPSRRVTLVDCGQVRAWPHLRLHTPTHSSRWASLFCTRLCVCV